MKLPFTLEQFLECFKKYNLDVWPAQVILLIAASLLVILSIVRHRLSRVISAMILAFLWVWMGLVYHILYFSAINKAAYFFGGFFLAESILLLYLLIKTKTSFSFNPDIKGFTGAFLIVFALVGYPIVATMNGHAYPYIPSFGLPCPTTIFTFGLFCWSDKRIPRWLWVIPVLWSIVGFSASFTLGMYEDIGLPIAGFVALLLGRKKTKR